VQSPNGNHLRTAADGSTRPTLQQVGGKYVLRFDGSDDIMYADTPFYIPGSSTAYTAIAGIKAAAQASARNIIAAASTTNTAPSLAPMQSDTTTTSLKQSGRNNSFSGGVFPSLPNILDNTARVVTSAFSAAGVQRMRDASLRPSDGSAGSSYTSTTNASLGLLIDADRMAIGGSAGATPGAYFAGDLFPMFVINRYLTDDETMFGEEWEANRSLSTALPGQVGPLDGYALGSVGTVAVAAPAGTASGGGVEVHRATALVLRASSPCPRWEAM
jgi:hypothetical protein